MKRIIIGEISKMKKMLGNVHCFDPDAWLTATGSQHSSGEACNTDSTSSVAVESW